MKKFTILICFILLITGCTENNGQVELSLETNKDTYSTDDDINVTVTVKNIDKEPIDFTVLDSCENGIQLSVETNYSAALVEKNTNKECEENLQYKTLQPGKSFSIEKTYLPELDFFVEETIPAPDDEYTLTAVFLKGKLETAGPNPEYDPPVTQKKIKITGGPHIISWRKAEETVKKQKEYRKWISDHTGKKVARRKDGQFYVNQNDQWTKVGEETYHQALKEEPTLEYSFTENSWLFHSSSILGTAPHSIEIKLDAKTGKVLDITN
ncbi:hypothetical protein [Pseudalkalibacillus caeni]|uniref:Intracellular proteinase inhibitor BsuPI domain-containing protein n=1 Tax=Exobacillus caeni TaxID=2574798 RepID=A0A5R9F6S4_9BACL|nr:hypothetical protein [Pseudalkalibacillus caeni]TLS38209.1 hypothetical protein FCL54_06640 [Pseudalkalibacillus caeni]